MAVDVSTAPKPKGWARSFPPLTLLAVAVLITAFVLPSSLNLPQSNPATVLEYAPVPPEDDDPPPASEGNSSAFGLGSSNSLTEPAAPLPPPPPPPDGGEEKTILAKKCIEHEDGVRRQTFDPLAPPCAQPFTGSNRGATYQGVERNAIRVLIYLDVGCTNSECPPTSDRFKIIDLQRPPKGPCPKSYPIAGQNCDYLPFRIARAFNRYFNDAFETYGRRVQYYAFISQANSEATRKKDAAELHAALKPFAVIDQATFAGFNQEFGKAMAARGVMVFSSEGSYPNAHYREAAPRAWGFWPDVEHWVDQYVTYVCTKVAGHPVRRYGNPPYTAAPNGEERVFGLYYTTDQGENGLQRFRELAMPKLQRCGVDWGEAEGTYPHNGFVVKGGDTGLAQREAVSTFIENDVTTVLWLGGVEGKFTQFANERGYFPEIVFAGDLDADNNATGRNQNQNVWKNAWGTTNHPRMPRPELTYGFRAYQEGDPEAQREEARYANLDYRDHFLLFMGIQVAGDPLNPIEVDKGFHNFLRNRSSDPEKPAVFFDQQDYSAVKDAAEIWWDPTGIPPGGADAGSASGATGCYRMVSGGTRYLAGEWTNDARVFENADDPCTAYEGARRIDPT